MINRQIALYIQSQMAEFIAFHPCWGKFRCESTKNLVRDSFYLRAATKFR